MTITKEQRRRKVFLLGRTIFVGDHSLVRDRATVARIVSQHRDNFREVIQGSTESSVVDLILNYLKEGTFESELKAKLRFPELFQPSPERSARHEISEQEAVQSETEALRLATNDRPVFVMAEGTKEELDEARPKSSKQPLQDRPSLFPTYLSYASQHDLLNFVQRLLENCCYDFTARWIPHLLVEKSWDCAQAVELGQWVQLLPQRFAEIQSDATTAQMAQALGMTLEATVRIRHAAVHRLPTNAHEVERMIVKALDLTRTLKDVSRTVKLEVLKQHLSATIKDLELHKNSLENDLDFHLSSINEQRRELDIKEEETKTLVLCQDKAETDRISAIIQVSIEHIEAVDESTLVHSRESRSDIEIWTEDEI